MYIRQFLNQSKKLNFINRFLSSNLNFRAFYGQAGTLQLNLDNKHCYYQVNLKTIWEDYTDIEVISENQELTYEDFILDENKNLAIFSQLSENKVGKYILNIAIPEYYSYKGKINGNLIHSKGEVDAKIYGDVDVKLHQGGFKANKIKSKNASIICDQDNISIGRYLETETGHLKLDKGTIDIRKLATSGVIKIDLDEGNIQIGSFYANITKHSLKFESIRTNLNQLLEAFSEEIKKMAHLDIQTQNIGNFSIKFFHGGLKFKGNKIGNLILENVSNGFFIIEINEGNVDLSNISDQSNGIIFIKEGVSKIKMSSKIAHNIYLSTKQSFHKKFIEGSPSIFIFSSSIVLID